MDDPTATAPTRPRKAARGKITIRDLAEHLDLTKGTVSRALNGYTDISAETRRRVSEAARAMGYRASGHARAIRTGRSEAIGLVLNVGEEDACTPFLSDFLDGLSRRLSEENWTLSVATAFSEAETLDTFRRMVEAGKVDGFVLPRTKRDDARVRLLRAEGIPFVMFGRTEVSTGCAWHDISGETAMHDAVLRLARFGHTRIGYVGADPENNFERLRHAGFVAGMAAARLAVDPDLVRDGAMSDGAGQELGTALLRSAAPPTAIVCAVDRAALGVCRAIAEAGLKPGREVSVIGYDGIPEGAFAQPPLTTFAVDTRASGRRLAEFLIRRIAGEPAEALREEVPATLLARGTDGPPAMTPQQIAAHVADRRGT